MFGAYIYYVYISTMKLQLKQETMKDLEQKIKDLKKGRTLKQIKEEDKKMYYRIQGLSKKLSEMKSMSNVVSKEHLTELKPLLIYIFKKESNYNTKQNMIEVMTELLNTEINYVTKKGIKSRVCEKFSSLIRTQNMDKFIEINGYEEWRRREQLFNLPSSLR